MAVICRPVPNCIRNFLTSSALSFSRFCRLSSLSRRALLMVDRFDRDERLENCAGLIMPLRRDCPGVFLFALRRDWYPPPVDDMDRLSLGTDTDMSRGSVLGSLLVRFVNDYKKKAGVTCPPVHVVEGM